MKKSERRYAAGEVIFREGDPAEAAYVIASGRVEMLKESDNGQIQLAELQPGEMFGEMGILDHSPRSATARATEDCVIQIVNREDFMKTVRNEPDVAIDVMQRMATRLRGTDDMLVGGKGKDLAPVDPESQGLIDRFLATFRRAKGLRLEIRIADLPSDKKPETKARPEAKKDPKDADTTVADAMKRLLGCFEKRKGIGVKPLGFSVGMDHKGNPDAEMAAAVSSARHGLKTTEADLVIWCDIPPPGATLYLRFVSEGLGQAEKPGSFLPSTAFTLPVDFEHPFGDLLVGIALSAIEMPDGEKTVLLDDLLAKAGEEAAAIMANLPDGLTSREKGNLHLCYANMAETIALRLSRGDLHSLAAKHYKEALGILKEQENPLAWALAKKHLATLLYSAGERSQGRELFEETVDACRDAMRVFTKLDFPLLWADLQNRLGLSLYRLEDKDSDGDMLKHAISAYQSALQVYTKTNHPEKWADVMHNLAQSAQLLGGHLRSLEALEKAVEACEGALSVRSRDKEPLKWAATQNTLGSVLFLLAKQAKSWSTMGEAAKAFANARDVYAEKGVKRLELIAEKNLIHAEKILKKRTTAELPNNSWGSDG